MPRSTRVTLDTIGKSIPNDNFFQVITGAAETGLVSALHKESNIQPDPETLVFLHKIQQQIDTKYKVKASEIKGEDLWAYRFSTLFSAMDSFADSVKTEQPALPWSVTGGREIPSPKENSVLLENRHINKFVTDWSSLVELIRSSLVKVKD